MANRGTTEDTLAREHGEKRLQQAERKSAKYLIPLVRKNSSVTGQTR